MMFAQYCLLELLGLLGVISGRADYTAEQIEAGAADLLICLEMVVAAVAHYFVFGHQEHQSGFYQVAP